MINLNLSYRMPWQYGESGAAKGKEEGGAAKVDALVVAKQKFRLKTRNQKS